MVEYKEVQTHTKMELPNISDTKPASTPPETPPTEAETPPVASTKEVVTAPPPPATPAVVAPEKKVSPVAPVASRSILPGTTLTKEDKAEISSKRKDSLAQARFLKHLTFLLILASVMWFLWIQINTSLDNSVLSLFGVNENIGQKIERVKRERTKIKLQNNKLEQTIEKIQKQLKDGTYTRFSTEIKNIREHQVQWFDEFDSDKKIVEYGFIDAVPRMQEYFNNSAYHDRSQIISGSHGDIQIENLQVSRDGITFSVLGSQILGKVFYLNIEFVEMVNSFSFLKNGVLSQFARQENEEGEDMMRFSVRLERQLPKEKDPADERFNEYTTWLNSIPKEEDTADEALNKYADWLNSK